MYGPPMAVAMSGRAKNAVAARVTTKQITRVFTFSVFSHGVRGPYCTQQGRDFFFYFKYSGPVSVRTLLRAGNECARDGLNKKKKLPVCERRTRIKKKKNGVPCDPTESSIVYNPSGNISCSASGIFLGTGGGGWRDSSQVKRHG